MTCCPFTTDVSTGGIVVGGSAIVDITNDLYDGMIAVWPLDEAADGTAEEYKDRTRNQLHGTGGNGDDLELVPLRDDGVFCSYCQHTDGRQYIQLPEDPIGNQPITISLWARVETTYQSRTWISLGEETQDGDNWRMQFGFNFLNRLFASLQVVDSSGNISLIEVMGSSTLAVGSWYHCALVIEPGTSARLYIDGVLDGTTTMAQTELVANTNSGYLLKWNEGQIPTGTLQEVRVYGEVKSAEYLLAEKNNFCMSGFYSVGAETVETIETVIS